MESNLSKLKEHEMVKAFIEKYKIDDETLLKNQLVLERFISQFVFCNTNEKMALCKQIIPGVQQKLSYKNKQFYITSSNCNHWIFENQDYKLEKNIVYADYDIFENTQTLDEFVKANKDKLVENANFFNAAKKILMEKEKTKGLYLYGLPGIGKTFYMKILANTFAKMDRKVVLVTVNKLIKIVKDTFNQNSSEENNRFFDQCCKVDVLILDDIGAEMVTDWSRDELLFGLLNTRMENNKLTFFTSNFPIHQLEDFYLNKRVTANQKDFEKMKTIRFTERIKGLSYEIEIKGKNHRY
ncbi:primosomal protein DnaI [Spiroplasma chinense]|uniref:Primosomal protein DnaI n=1 Tax=Spiroplasma chinense TaxID=216932 RepID=A0A5B9Y659_9MOLU|nr:DnaA/Hda family protein [Spiroplasma chinense]QEH62206.1 primosomal protein DnaI [Spiroplasma chinense]